MSALGQKQTSRHLQPMSALPPKADIGTQSRDVRFVPKADSCTAAINAKLKRGSAYRQLARLIPVWTETASRRRATDSSSPMSVMRTRTVARMAATITNLLWNKGNDGSDSRANKNRLYVRTDVRRLRRTTRFERNDPNDAQTRSCPRKRERALHRTADTADQ